MGAMTAVPSPGPHADAGAEAGVRAAVRAVWTRARPDMEHQLRIIEDAVLRLTDGSLDEPRRVAAQRAAHKLAGSAGTFGFARAGTVAGELEGILAEPSGAAGPRAAELVGVLRAELGTDQAAESGDDPDDPVDAGAPERPVVLVVDPDSGRADQLRTALRAKGLATRPARDARSARLPAEGPSPAAALVHVGDADLDAETVALLEHLSGTQPPTPVFVTGSRLGTLERVAAARAGVTAFLDRERGPAQLAEAVAGQVERARSATARVLVVDDDPSMLAAVSAILRSYGLEVVALDDPRRFWEVLVEHVPDLVVLDIDMPHVDGLELCRLVRGDSRWRDLPVLFLSARVDAEVVRDVFTAGADDYVAKPVVGPELAGRIHNRLDRVRLHRQLAETDPLTGLANRRKLEHELPRLQQLGRRDGRAVTVAVLDVDRFKLVNDRYGHAAGDVVLQQLAGWLVRHFRKDELVARLGGEEFVVVGLGMARDTAVARLSEVLLGFRRTGVRVGEDLVAVGVSAGVAECPQDGEDFPRLYRAADAALGQAKEAGRGRVLPAGWRSPGGG